MKKTSLLILFSLGLFCLPVRAQQPIQIEKIPFKPSLDGMDTEWSSVQAVEIPVNGPLTVGKVIMKAGIYGKEVFFIFKWADTTHDTLHRPFVWNEEKQRYIDGDQREDRLAMQWEMSGDFTHDWQSGKSFIADMWHWKSARSNPIGLAHDKIINISTNPSRKAIRIKGKGGQSIYIKRDSDDGDIYKSERVKDVRQDDVMLRYHLLSNPKGSVADVSAKGVWQNNEWTLELSRKLNTGQKDDAVFIPGKTIRAAIAIFDRTGGDEHNISDTLVFQF